MFAPDQLMIPPACFRATDLSRPLRLERRFDLAVCLEVAEHLPESLAERLVSDLVKLAPVVLFSAAIPGQGGTGHLNERFPSYWAEHFRKWDYTPIDCLRSQIWKSDEVDFWYVQNTIVYASMSQLSAFPALGGRGQRLWYGVAGCRAPPPAPARPISHPGEACASQSAKAAKSRRSLSGRDRFMRPGAPLKVLKRMHIYCTSQHIKEACMAEADVANVAISADIDRREAAYWDNDARSITEGDLTESVTLSDAVRLRFDSCGDLLDKKLLDVGCGSGLWSVLLAQRGAQVYAIDISPEMVALTQRRATLNGVGDRVLAKTMSARKLEFPDGFFDCVHGQDIVHHLEPGDFGREVARVLAPGGRAVFRENSGNNPILMWARNTLCGRFGISKWSSDDEYPLTPKRRNAFTRHFSSTRIEYPEFRMFHYVDAKFFHRKVKAATFLCDGIDGLL